MLVEQPHQLVGVEELACDVAGEPFLHLVVVAVLAQPVHHRHGEAELLLLRPVLRDGALGRLAQRELGLRFVGLERRGDGRRHIEDTTVQKRHAGFQRMGHGHLVCFQEDVADQPEVQVHVLHARGFVQVLDLGVYRCGELLGGRGVAAAAQQLGTLLDGEGDAVGVGVVPVFGGFAGALKVVRSADAQLAHDAGSAAQQTLRGPGELRVGERRLIDAVTAEEFVGAFAGKHRLDLRCGDLVHEVQCHSGRVGGGLVHVPLHAG